MGDGFKRNLAPFVDRVAAEYADFPVYGGACEAHEMIWRIVGTENVMMWMAEYPERHRPFRRAAPIGHPSRADQGRARTSSSGATWPTRKACFSHPFFGAGASSLK